MPTIKLLSEQLINQIAAGEVVERPASVVKELLENSLDAGATHITIEIKGGGDSFLRITDDGIGMDSEDAVMAFEAHATSKITETADLFNIHTLGFRGEAIASIASVSYITLQTKKKGELEGTLVMAEGGKINKVKAIGVPEGTQIEVKQLFFNTPARKKYLKNPLTEYNHVFNTVSAIALTFPQVAFRLVHDDKVVFDLAMQEDHWSRIHSLMGKTIAEELIPVFYGHSQVQLQGFIGKPVIARSNRNEQYLFVNQRAVKSHVLSYAVKESYHSLLPKEKHPIFFLYFQVNPELVDVNVHPRKQEVRFRDEKEIFLLTNQACQKALEKYVLAPHIDEHQPVNYYQERKQLPLVLEDRNGIPKSMSEVQGSGHATFSGKERISKSLIEDALSFTEKMAQGDLTQERGTTDKNAPSPHPEEQRLVMAEKKYLQTDLGSFSEAEHQTFRPRETMEEIVPLAQLAKAFILCQQGKNLIIVDQHAAHERIRYTEILQEFEEKKITIQPLLNGEIFEFSVKEIALLEENQELLKGMGFEIESFGGNSFMVQSVPHFVAQENLHQTLLGLLDDFSQQASKGDFQKRKERSLIYMACRSAVKFGDTLSAMEQAELLRKLMKVPQPYTCPHGRPTIVTMSFDELKKRFGREY